MKITVLCFDLSHNCLGRAHLLARLVEREYDVEVVGPRLKGDVWEPVQDDYEYKSVPMGPRVHSSLRKMRQLLKKITGDVVYASKPRMTSYGIALVHAISQRKPLLLDIDDWESSLKRPDENGIVPYLKELPQVVNLNSFYYTRTFESLIWAADARTVSNTRLQDKFGGQIIPHARDTDVFDPNRFDKAEARDRLGLPTSETLVMFPGTPRPHKGVLHLVQAVSELDRDDVRTVVVGAHDSTYVEDLRAAGGENLLLRGRQPFSQLPEWIAAADIIAIPQRRLPDTEGQLPAKVFDAMAMAKPIVATNVSDLPKVLDDCGVIVEPDSPDAIATAIDGLLADPAKRERLGRRARERCVECYSYDAVAPQLCGVVEGVVASEE